MGILHITNGELSLEVFKTRILDAKIVAFNEAICVGEVEDEIFSDEFVKRRCASLNVDKTSYCEKMQIFFKKCELLKYEILQLYFDFDMFCQINVLTLLAFLEQINFTGQIFYNIFDYNNDYKIVSSNKLQLGIYKNLFKQVVINKKLQLSKNPDIDFGIKLFCDFQSPNNELYQYILQNLNEDRYSLCKEIIIKFPQYGIGDTAIYQLIDGAKVE